MSYEYNLKTAYIRSGTPEITNKIMSDWVHEHLARSDWWPGGDQIVVNGFRAFEKLHFNNEADLLAFTLRFGNPGTWTIVTTVDKIE